MDHVLLIDQVIEVEVNRVRQRSGVLIKKCRYEIHTRNVRKPLI